MIKLIASDLDGTLLDSQKNLPPDFFKVFDELERRGITFAVASGRTYTAADHLFPAEYLNRMTLICDNGACTYSKGRMTHAFPLERSVYNELLDACERIGGFQPVVCAESGVFHLKSSAEFFNRVGIFYRTHQETDDLRTVGGKIYKLAVCDEMGTYAHGKPLLDAVLGDKLNIQVSGDVWMDIMAAGVSKGAALRELQRRLGVTAEETMAFGDYFNDLDMLNAAVWSFCPENGHEEIKKQTRFVCADCDSGGVVDAIKKYALSEDAV